jgi:hypothetical protein
MRLCIYRPMFSWLRLSFTPRPLYPRGNSPPGTHWIAGWVGPRAGLDDMEKWKFLPSPGLELRPLGRLSRSQSLYRYPGSSEGSGRGLIEVVSRYLRGGTEEDQEQLHPGYPIYWPRFKSSTSRIQVQSDTSRPICSMTHMLVQNIPGFLFRQVYSTRVNLVVIKAVTMRKRTHRISGSSLQRREPE